MFQISKVLVGMNSSKFGTLLFINCKFFIVFLFTSVGPLSFLLIYSLSLTKPRLEPSPSPEAISAMVWSFFVAITTNSNPYPSHHYHSLFPPLCSFFILILIWLRFIYLFILFYGLGWFGFGGYGLTLVVAVEVANCGWLILAGGC